MLTKDDQGAPAALRSHATAAIVSGDHGRTQGAPQILFSRTYLQRKLLPVHERDILSNASPPPIAPDKFVLIHELGLPTIFEPALRTEDISVAAKDTIVPVYEIRIGSYLNSLWNPFAI